MFEKGVQVPREKQTTQADIMLPPLKALIVKGLIFFFNPFQSNFNPEDFIDICKLLPLTSLHLVINYPLQFVCYLFRYILKVYPQILMSAHLSRFPLGLPKWRRHGNPSGQRLCIPGGCDFTSL